MGKDNYSRSEDLKNKLNSFISSFTEEDKNYFDSLSKEQLLGLKKALAYINNYLTLKTTLAMGKWIAKYFKLSRKEEDDLLKKIDEIKPNTNGYDIELKNHLKVIVEIKCIIPINNGNSFGAAQRNAILDDALKLIKGKKRSIPNTEQYIKIIGLLDVGEKTDNAIEELVNPMGKIRSKNQISQDRRNIIKKLVVVDNSIKPNDLTTEYIYLKRIQID